MAETNLIPFEDLIAKDKGAQGGNLIPFEDLVAKPTVDIYSKANDRNEFLRNLVNIEKSITYDDSEYRQNVIDSFFGDLPTGDLPETTDDDPTSLPTARIDVTGVSTQLPYTSEDQLIKHFGKDKYDLFKKYQETGDLKIEDIPESLIPGFQRAKQQEKEKLAQFRKEEYARNNKHLGLGASYAESIAIDPEVRDEYPTDFIENYEKFEEKAKVIGTREDYMSGLGEWLFGVTTKKQELTTEALKLQRDYLTVLGDSLKTDIEGYWKDLAKLGIKSSAEVEDFLNNTSIDIQTRRDILEKTNNIVTQQNSYLKKAAAYDDKDAVLKALNLNYSYGYSTALSLENVIAGDMGQFVLGIGGTIGVPGAKEAYTNHIDYSESVKKRMQTTKPTQIPVKDVEFGKNFGTFVAQQLSNNSFSIAAAATYSGLAKRLAGRFVKQGMAPLVAQTRARKIAQGVMMSTWVGAEGGSRLSQMEISQKNADANIKYINKRLEDKTLTPDERLMLHEAKESSLRALDYTRAERAWSAISYGGIAALAERMGTMRWLDDFNDVRRVYGDNVIKNLLHATGNWTLRAPLVEGMEEVATQIGHNLMDIMILDEDKSLIEGLDPDFFASVYITTLAIGGKGTAKNVADIFHSSVLTKAEKKKYDQLADEFIENQYILNEGTNLSKGGINKKQADILKARQLEILDELSYFYRGTLNKVSDLEGADVTRVFDIVARQRQLYKMQMELGGIGKSNDYVKRQRKKFEKEYDDLQIEKETILGKPAKQRNEKLEETAKKLKMEREEAMKYAFSYGRFAQNVADMKGIGNTVKLFDGDTDAEIKKKVEEFLQEQVKNEVISEEEAKQHLDNYDISIKMDFAGNIIGRQTGAFGTYIGNTLIVYENNVRRGLLSSDPVVRAEAEQVAIHEYQHRYDIETGLVKGGQVIKSHRQFVLEAMDSLKTALQNEDISTETYEAIEKRLKGYNQKQYVNEKNKSGIDTAELMVLLGTLKRAGIISKEKSSLGFAAKSLLNRIRAAMPGLKENYHLLQINSAEDVLRYVDTFNRKVQQKQMAVLPPEEEGKEIKQSLGSRVFNQINDLIPENVKTRNDFLEFFTDPKRNAELGKALGPGGIIDNVVKQKTVGGEYQRTIDEVRDRVMNFNPEAVREDGAVVGREGFVESIFANIGFGRMEARKELAIEAKKKKKEKRIEQPTKEGEIVKDVEDTKELTPEEQMIQQEEMSYEDYTSQVSKIVEKIVVGKGDSYEQFKEKIKQGVRKTLGTKLPGVEYTKKYKQALQKAYEIEFKNLLQEYFDTGKNYDKFIEKYFPTIFNTNVISLEDLIQMERLQKKKIFATKRRITKPTEVDKLIEQGLLPKTVNRLSGPNLITRLKLSMEKDENKETPYMKFFNPPKINPKTGKPSGLRGTRKDKLAERIVSKLAFAATMEVLDEQDVRYKRRDISKLQGQQQFENDTEMIANALDVDPSIKMSLGTELTGANYIIQSNYLVDAVNANENFDDVIDIEKRKAKIKINGLDFDQIVVDQVIEGYQDGVVFSKDFKFKIGKKIHTIEQGKFSKSYEQSGIENIITQAESKKLPYVTVLYREVYEGDVEILNIDGKIVKVPNPDVTIVLFKDTPLEMHIPIEYKAGDARMPHNVAFYANFKNKTFKRKEKLSPKSEKKIKEAIQKVVNKTHAIRKRIKDEIGVDLTDSDVVFTKDQYNKMKALGLKALTNDYSVEVDGDFMIEQYNLKGNYLLQVGGVGGFILGEDIYGFKKALGISKLKGKFFLTARLNPSKVKGGYKLKVDTEGSFKVKGITSKTNFSFDNSNSLTDILNTPAIQARLKAYKALKSNIKQSKKLNDAVNKSREIKQSRGITVLDFDDTLATTKSLVKFTRPDGTTGTLNAEEYASTYEDLLDQGYTFDFSDFNKVVKGKLAPLFQKALKLQKKFGPENMFILTARPSAAQKAIYDFLKANGLNIPLKNITGLGNSTAEAKALWIADKVAEGYNDFYFADDALQNVQAVKNMLNQFDVKSKIQQAKVKFSRGMDVEFNKILEEVTGIDAKKRFSDIKARKRGASKGKFRFFIPPSHEDFVGLLYNFIGKGKKGNAHRDFFEEALIKPLNRADRELNIAKQSIANDYKSLNKQFKDVKKKLTKKTPDGDFTYQDAIRVYLWNKHGHKVPGLSKTDQQGLVDLVMNDAELRQYAETLNIISKQDTYVKPTESWEAGDIRIDLDDATGRIGREEFFAEFFENTNIIFSQENLNKIEAAYGAAVVSAIKDMLYRIKTGRNRPSGQNKMVNQFLNYLNGSVASTMFFNIRSAVLQQMSMVNFINFGDNNILAAAKAFANQKQYWKDYAMIFNSDFMKQRRKGIQTDVNGAELAASVKNATNPVQAIIKKLLELGFLPTQIGDNNAIALGGATYYRNRVNTYLKQGMTQKEAESKAWIDFQTLAEATQQSAKPWMISMQQASPLGKVILAFQNVTSQFNRLGKKAFLDLKNRRISPEYKNASNPQLQSDISNLSRIAYYLAIQNLIFYSLQSALFMALFNDDEDDERWLKKKERVINGSIDSVLRGTGVWGAAIATLKNMAIKWHEQRDKGWNKDESAVLMEMLNVSPPLGIKARKMVSGEKDLNYNKKVIDEMETFDIDNPIWSAVTNYIEATTNIPTNRLYNKTQNVRQSLNNQHSAFERVLMFSGWSQWNLGIPNEEVEKIKKTKSSNKKKSRLRAF